MTTVSGDANATTTAFDSDINIKKTQLWLGFWKFVLGTVVLGAFSTFLAHRIQQQELDIKAQKQDHELRTAEQQYLERIADRVQAGGTSNRRVLAQMMTHVSQTSVTRQRWTAYLDSIESDLRAEKAAAKEKDALVVQVNDQQKRLLELKQELEKAGSKITAESKANAEKLKLEIAKARSELQVKELTLSETNLELERLRNELRTEPKSSSRTIEVSLDDLESNANLTGRRVKNIYDFGAELQGIVFTGADLNDVGFGSGNLTNAAFDGARLSSIHLQDASLYKASFQNAILTDVDFSGANLREANFTGANIIKSSEPNKWTMTFERADLRGTKGLTCEMLRQAENWESAIRDTDLICGAVTAPEQQLSR